MELKLDNKHYIKSDSLCYTLIAKSERVDNEGVKKEYERVLGYYGTIEGALKGYKERQIKNSDVKTMNELLELIKGIDTKIKDVLGGN